MLDFRHSPCEYLKVNTSVQQVQGHKRNEKLRSDRLLVTQRGLKFHFIFLFKIIFFNPISYSQTPLNKYITER
jgi:hypothetical protein